MSPLRRAVVFGLVALLTLVGCSGPGDPDPSDPSAPPPAPGVLRVLAGSEVRDLAPMLAAAEAATGVRVELAYAGTLEGAELVAAGGADGRYDATWFSSDRYLGLLPGAADRTVASVRTMASPVVLGVRPAVARDLGWDRSAPTWGQVAAAVDRGRLSFAMTNPAASNSGFSALVGVATALSGTGGALTEADITRVTPGLQQFFAGQVLTAGSSAYLVDRFLTPGTGTGGRPVDAMINYESVLLQLARRTPSVELTVVRPTDGVVTADYPLTLLAARGEQRELFTRLTDWLRTPESQARIMAETSRRPVVPGVALGPEFGPATLLELPFPNRRSVADGLVTAYLNQIRRPTQTVFVLDVSSSMKGDRLVRLKRVLEDLAGADTSVGGGFARFRDRERVTMLPFGSAPGTPTTFVVPEGGSDSELARIRAYAGGLRASGRTAVYSSLLTAYELAGRQVAADPDTFTSIVLLSDGGSNRGSSLADFLRRHQGLTAPVKAVPVFPVLFGEGDMAELERVAAVTGGKTFDARSGDLATAFREIRGYQ